MLQNLDFKAVFTDNSFVKDNRNKNKAVEQQIESFLWKKKYKLKLKKNICKYLLQFISYLLIDPKYTEHSQKKHQ